MCHVFLPVFKRSMSKPEVVKLFRTIPWIGPATAEDFYNLKLRSFAGAGALSFSSKLIVLGQTLLQRIQTPCTMNWRSKPVNMSTAACSMCVGKVHFHRFLFVLLTDFAIVSQIRVPFRAMPRQGREACRTFTSMVR